MLLYPTKYKFSNPRLDRGCVTKKLGTWCYFRFSK